MSPQKIDPRWVPVDEPSSSAIDPRWQPVDDDRTVATTQPPKAKGWLDRPSLEDFPVFNLINGAWHVAKEIPAGLYHMAKDVAPFDASGKPKMPMGDTVELLGQAQGNVGLQAKDAFDRGDYFRASIKGVEYLIPILGPMMAASGDKMESGHIAEGIGELAMSTALMAQPFAPKGAPTTMAARLGMPSKLNAAEAEAVAFAKANDVPLDLGTATGSQFVKNVQKKVGGSWGGANTVETAQRAQADALAKVGTRVAEDANVKPNGAPGPAMEPVTAGESVQAAIRKKIETHHADATTAYDKLRQFEQDPANINRVTLKPEIRSKPTSDGRPGAVIQQAVTQDMALAVDLTNAKAALKPIYDRMLRESELVPLQGDKGRALTALDRLMKGPDVSPLSVVDDALGDLKAMARGAEMPELRTQSQGAAAKAVHELDELVRARAKAAGPDVLKALEDGRASTRAKYATSGAMDLIEGSATTREPRSVFSRLTAQKDSGITKLRELKKVAPQELPNVARAFLEDVLDKPTSEGGFKFADKAQADWQKLGSESKTILFPKPGQAQALDSFFLLAKKIGENPNPSGTAQVLGATQLLAGIPSYAFAKMLYSPTSVRLLTRGLRLSLDTAPPAKVLAAEQFARAASEAGVVIPFPKAAETEPQSKR